MLMGQNLDVAYRGKTVHIQTEDLGRNVNKIMTQVFHSGAILDSRTVPYANEIEKHSDVAAQNEVIRKLMLALHKYHYNKVFSGAYDEKLRLPPLEPSASDAPVGKPAESTLKVPLAGSSAELSRSQGVPPPIHDINDTTDPGARASMRDTSGMGSALNSNGPFGIVDGEDVSLPGRDDLLSGDWAAVEAPAPATSVTSIHRAFRGFGEPLAIDVALAEALGLPNVATVH
jgi:hypothetical protein